MRLLVKPIGVALWLGLLLIGAAFVGAGDFLHDYEQAQLVDHFKTSPDTGRKFPSEIALVEINAESVHIQDRPPWDLGRIATLIANLRKAKPKVIALELPLLQRRASTYTYQLKQLLAMYNKLHPEPPKPTTGKKKKKKRRRRRYLSRRQRQMLAQKKALQKQIEAVRKKLKEIVEEPGYKRLMKEIKATKNLVLSYPYYREKDDIPGADGLEFKRREQVRKEHERAKKKGKKFKLEPFERPLYQLRRPLQQVGGKPLETPGLEVFYLNNSAAFTTLVQYHGFLNLSRKPGQTFYKARLVVRQRDKLYPSLALAAWIAYTGKDPVMLVNTKGFVGIDLQSHTLPLTPDGKFSIMYYGPRRKIPRDQRIAAGDVIAGKNFSSADVHGKLVFVGYSSYPYARHFRTPYDENFSSLELHATIAANLLKGLTLRRDSTHWMIELGLILLLGLLLGGVMMKFRNLFGFIVTAVCCAVLQFTNHFFLFPNGDWYQFGYVQFALVMIYLGIVVVRRYTEDIKRMETENRFRPKMGKEEFERVLKNPGSIDLEGSWREVTVLTGHTLPLGASLSEENNPKQITKLLAHLTNPMGEAICRNHGTIGQLDGHSFQGFFNAPFDLPDHAVTACHAALQMRSESEPFLHQWELEGLPKPNFGVGLDIGHVVAGNMGGTERFLYSVVGAPVEFSREIKALNHHYKSNILLSEALYQQIKDSQQFVVRELDWVRLHDEQAAIVVYELLDHAPVKSPYHEAVEWYQQGLKLYRERNFQEATRYFQEILRVRPDDGPAQVMAERCQRYIHYPPSFQWDGAYRIK